MVVSQTEKVMSETEKLVAEYAAERTELLSDAELTAANTMAVATADGDAEVIKAGGRAYTYLANKLSFTVSELMRFIYYSTVATKSQTMVAGVGDGSTIVNTNAFRY